MTAPQSSPYYTNSDPSEPRPGVLQLALASMPRIPQHPTMPPLVFDRFRRFDGKKLPPLEPWLPPDWESLTCPTEHLPASYRQWTTYACEMARYHKQWEGSPAAKEMDAIAYANKPGRSSTADHWLETTLALKDAIRIVLHLHECWSWQWPYQDALRAKHVGDYDSVIEILGRVDSWINANAWRLQATGPIDGGNGRMEDDGDSVARTETVTDQMARMLKDDHRLLNRSAAKWAKQLGCSANAVKKTLTWSVIIKERLEQERELKTKHSGQRHP